MRPGHPLARWPTARGGKWGIPSQRVVALGVGRLMSCRIVRQIAPSQFALRLNVMLHLSKPFYRSSPLISSRRIIVALGSKRLRLDSPMLSLSLISSCLSLPVSRLLSSLSFRMRLLSVVNSTTDQSNWNVVMISV